MADFYASYRLSELKIFILLHFTAMLPPFIKEQTLEKGEKQRKGEGREEKRREEKNFSFFSLS
jgi:hypothetical protein